MVLLLCSPRKQIHNSPSPRLGTPGGTIRDYEPRAVKEVTFSVTVQTAAYLFESSGKQWEIVIAYDARAATRATAMAARTSKKQLE